MPRALAPFTGIELEYEVMGEGEPLLLIMGLGAQLVHWPDGFCETLVKRGFQVIRFDNRDTGRSSKMRGRVPDLRLLIGKRLLDRSFETPYTLLDMADDAAGLLEALGIPSAHVAGVSMGGMIAQTLAIMHPQRVRSLTSIMSASGSRRSLLSLPRAIKQLLKPGPGSRAEAIENEIEFFKVCGGVGAHAPDLGLVRDMAERAYDRGFNPSGYLRQLAAILAAPDRAPALRYVRVPTTVIHGSADPLILPLAGRVTAQAVPGARLCVFPQMGHDLPPSTWRPIAEELRVVAGRAVTAKKPARARAA